MQKHKMLIILRILIIPTTESTKWTTYLYGIEREERNRRIARVPVTRLKDRSNLIEDLGEIEFKKRFHMTKETAGFVTDMIIADLRSEVKRGTYIPPILKVLITARFYATGGFQLSIADHRHANLNQLIVSRIVLQVSKGIAKFSRRHIKYPNQAEAVRNRDTILWISFFSRLHKC